MAAQNRNSKFVLQVYDGEKYRPCYIAPHATDKFYGDTKIVDTVITPEAEGKVGDTTAASTSTVPSPKAVSDAIVRALQNEKLPAARAKHLTTGKTIKFSGGGTFEATLSNALSTDYQEVNFTGVLPLSAIPKGAQERLVICSSKDAALTQAKNGEIQQGDVVQIPEGSNDGHNVMYYMYNVYSANATFDSLFKVFTAGHATDADKLNTDAGASTKPVYFSNGIPVACSATVGGSTTPTYMSGGTIAACTPYSEASVKHATSSDLATKATQDSAGQQINTTYIKGLSINGNTITYTKGSGTTGTLSITHPSALKNPNSLTISLTGGSTASVTYDGSQAKSISIPIPTIPASLKNPYALSFSGGSTVSYDGSSEQSVTIPVKVTN